MNQFVLVFNRCFQAFNRIIMQTLIQLNKEILLVELSFS